MARKIGRIFLHKQLRGGSKRWIVDLRPHGRIISSPDPVTGEPLPLASRKSAAAVLESIRGAYASGRTIQEAVAAFTRARTPENTLQARYGAWIERRREDCTNGEISPTYLRELVRYGRADGYVPWWRDTTIWEVDYGRLDDWSRSLAKQGLSPNTRRKVLGAFHAFLADLQRRGTIDGLPEFPTITVDEHVPRTTTLEVQDEIVAAIPEERRGAFLAARLGLRPGEVRASNVADYDFDTGVLTIRAAMKGPCSSAPRDVTKERNWRRIIIDTELREWIEKWVNPQGALDGSALFVNPTARRPGSRWLSNPLREEWNRAAEKVGVRVKMYEGTKHTSATEALRGGRRMEEIQKALGHRDRRSTEKYAKLAEVTPVDDIFRRRKS
jgi:integrase